MQRAFVSQVPTHARVLATSCGNNSFVVQRDNRNAGGSGTTITNMSFAFLLSLLPAILGLTAAPATDEVRTIIVQQEMIMRVPVRPMPHALTWEEGKGPKCVPATSIRGAALSGRESVDFLLFDRTRLRAELDEDCPALDFYNGFYLTPDDGRICAKRDGIHSRMGRSCRIEKFRRPIPKLVR